MGSTKARSYAKQRSDPMTMLTGVHDFDECCGSQDVHPVPGASVNIRAALAATRPIRAALAATPPETRWRREKHQPFAFDTENSSSLEDLIRMEVHSRKKGTHECNTATSLAAALAAHPILLTKTGEVIPYLPDSASVSQGQEGNVVNAGKISSVPPSKMLLVSKLPRCASEQLFRTLFGQFGKVTLASILYDTKGCSKCFGFVHFNTLQAAQKAVAECSSGLVTLQDGNGKIWHVKADVAMDGKSKRQMREGQKKRSVRRNSC
jgi:hypothetical protein